MPKIRRQNVPPALLDHLLDRIKERQISSEQLGALADWLDTEPEVPRGRWFKRFPGMRDTKEFYQEPRNAGIVVEPFVPNARRLAETPYNPLFLHELPNTVPILARRISA
jgi:hypothetical protein